MGRRKVTPAPASWSLKTEHHADRDALLDYLRGEWADCTHEGVGPPGCPTCEGRWSDEVRRVVQGHRDRMTATSALGLRAEREARIADLEAHGAQARRQRDEALAEVAELREQVEQLQARIAAERSVASADPSSERTRRAVGHLLDAIRQAAQGTSTLHAIDALAVLLGVDRG